MTLLKVFFNLWLSLILVSCVTSQKGFRVVVSKVQTKEINDYNIVVKCDNAFSKYFYTGINGFYSKKTCEESEEFGNKTKEIEGLLSNNSIGLVFVSTYFDGTPTCNYSNEILKPEDGSKVFLNKKDCYDSDEFFSYVYDFENKKKLIEKESKNKILKTEENRRFKISDFCKKKSEYSRFESVAIARKIAIGMPEELLILAWGKPGSINSTVTRYGTHKQYVYGSGQYVYTENGIITSWQSN